MLPIVQDELEIGVGQTFACIHDRRQEQIKNPTEDIGQQAKRQLHSSHSGHRARAITNTVSANFTVAIQSHIDASLLESACLGRVLLLLVRARGPWTQPVVARAILGPRAHVLDKAVQTRQHHRENPPLSAAHGSCQRLHVQRRQVILVERFLIIG